MRPEAGKAFLRPLQNFMRWASSRLTVIAVAGRPLPRALDPLVVVAPLVVALAGLGIRNVLASLRPATHVPAVLLVAALLAGVGAEGTQLIAGDERTSLGRIAAMVDDVDLDLPVVLAQAGDAVPSITRSERAATGAGIRPCATGSGVGSGVV